MSTPYAVPPAPEPRFWWQHGVIYQIYPRSFQDSNGDGIGDLRGITQRLGYLEWLGIDAIWISPVYPSPMADFGYDVCDYRGIDPVFGTLEDFDELVGETHGRGIRIIMDLIPNHSSDQHPWFVEARASRDNPKRDWYLWRDPAPGGGPPNNWLSNFGGSAWTLDETTGQYFYHAYLPQQPDLNWRNQAVQREMLDTMRFWLERGVDGFRIDALRQLVKDDQWRDNPPNPDHQPEQGPYEALLPLYTTDRPEMLGIVEQMRQVVNEYPERVLIGELYLPIPRLVAYYGATEGHGLHLPTNFHLLSVPWNAGSVAALIREYEGALPPHGWPNWVQGNHDRSRLASRLSEDQARLAALLLLTLRGTPTLYYGDEIGMQDVRVPPERVQDPWEKRVPGLGFGRDPARAPLLWDDSRFGGFSAAEPWLPLPADPHTQNVAAQREDPASILSLYRRLLDLRRSEPALSAGAYAALPTQGDVLAFLREAGGDRFVVLLNFGDTACTIALGDEHLRGTVALSNGEDRAGERLRGKVELGPCEGLVVRLGAPDRAG